MARALPCRNITRMCRAGSTNKLGIHSCQQLYGRKTLSSLWKWQAPLCRASAASCSFRCFLIRRWKRSRAYCDAWWPAGARAACVSAHSGIRALSDVELSAGVLTVGAVAIEHPEQCLLRGLEGANGQGAVLVQLLGAAVHARL